MAQWHLNELRNAIERTGWQFVAEHPSENLYLSASWEFKRNANEPPLFIDFEGVDDLRTLPIEESYGCHARGQTTQALYFRRRGEKDSARRNIWLMELKDFVASLNRSK